MKPIAFPGVNRRYGANQPQYLILPAHCDLDGTVTSCWELTWRERLKLLWTGKLWLQQMTFDNPLQPQRVSVEKPNI